MAKRVKLLLLAVVPAIFLSACAAGLSEYSRSQVTYLGPFVDVQKNPEQYQGETVLWGGKIIESAATEGRTELVVLQLELNRDRPLDNDQSQGRFLIHSPRFMDPAIYPPGTLISVVGRVQGAQERRIGQMPYQYPVIDVTEIKKWPAQGDPSPRFHFGFGIGTHF